MSLTKEQAKEAIKVIHNSIKIEDLLNHYGISYHDKKNNELNMVCINPNHPDSNPSMNFNTDKKKFNCLSCEAKGNWYTFVKYAEEKFNDRKLSAKAKLDIGAELAEVDLSSILNKTKFDENVTGLEYEIDYSEATVEKQEETFSDDVLKQFYRKTNTYFLSRGYKSETLKTFEMGFGVKGEMKDRCVFPVRDMGGRLLGWTGRSIFSHEKIKWFHAPQDRFFKGLTLYNIDKAYEHIVKTGEVHVYESVGNCMRAWENGKKNSVALLGNKMTVQQAEMLIKIANKVIICQDNDAGGHDMVMLSIDLLYGKVDLEFASYDFGLDDNGKAIDFGDATPEMFASVKYLTIDEYYDKLSEVLIDMLKVEFDKDYIIKMPNGTNILCTNELKQSYEGNQLLPHDIMMFQLIDKNFEVKKIVAV